MSDICIYAIYLHQVCLIFLPLIIKQPPGKDWARGPLSTPQRGEQETEKHTYLTVGQPESDSSPSPGKSGPLSALITSMCRMGCKRHSHQYCKGSNRLGKIGDRTSTGQAPPSLSSLHLKSLPIPRAVSNMVVKNSRQREPRH